MPGLLDKLLFKPKQAVFNFWELRKKFLYFVYVLFLLLFLDPYICIAFPTPVAENFVNFPHERNHIFSVEFLHSFFFFF